MRQKENGNEKRNDKKWGKNTNIDIYLKQKKNEEKKTKSLWRMEHRFIIFILKKMKTVFILYLVAVIHLYYELLYVEKEKNIMSYWYLYNEHSNIGVDMHLFWYIYSLSNKKKNDRDRLELSDEMIVICRMFCLNQ